MKGIPVPISGKNILVLFIALIITTSSCGCIKVVQKSLATNESTGEIRTLVTTIPSEDTTIPATIQPDVLVMETTPAPEITQNLTAVVESAVPITDDESYETLHAARVNETSRFNRSDIRKERMPEFEKTYTLDCNATGLIVDVKKGPLVIAFDIEPVFDCMNDPDSCRGSLTASVNRPYFTVTVRDNETHAIVAQEGYGREYSSETDDRSLTVYGAGRYHITLEGCFVTADLAIITGNSPLTDSDEDEDYDEDW
ncbi:MAG: hypothetical protein LUQ71_10000 [Methanoregula sp.]|nr:hypothetical protein [Methanoregula sp.]